MDSFAEEHASDPKLLAGEIRRVLLGGVGYGLLRRVAEGRVQLTLEHHHGVHRLPDLVEALCVALEE